MQHDVIIMITAGCVVVRPRLWVDRLHWEKNIKPTGKTHSWVFYHGDQSTGNVWTSLIRYILQQSFLQISSHTLTSSSYIGSVHQTSWKHVHLFYVLIIWKLSFPPSSVVLMYSERRPLYGLKMGQQCSHWKAMRLLLHQGRSPWSERGTACSTNTGLISMTQTFIYSHLSQNVYVHIQRLILIRLIICSYPRCCWCTVC